MICHDHVRRKTTWLLLVLQVVAAVVLTSTSSTIRMTTSLNTEKVAALKLQFLSELTPSLATVAASFTTVESSFRKPPASTVQVQPQSIDTDVVSKVEELLDFHNGWLYKYRKKTTHIKALYRRREVKIVANLAHEWHAEHGHGRHTTAPQHAPLLPPTRAKDERNNAFSDRDDNEGALDIDDHPGPAYQQDTDPWSHLSEVLQNDRRRQSIVDEFRHSWDAYKTHAWGFDELMPLTNGTKNWGVAPLALSMLDASTTLVLMGLDEEVLRVIDFIEKDLSFDVDGDFSQFELTIRALGSLVSLYEMTGEKHQKVIEKAIDLAKRLREAYKTPSGLPDTTINLHRGNHSNPEWREHCTALSEAGSVQLEMRAVSYHANNPCFDVVASRALAAIESKVPSDMMPRLFINTTDATYPADWSGIGALGDSYFEYIFKQYLLGNRTQIKPKIRFKQLVSAIEESLLQYSSDSPKLAYVGGKSAHGSHKKAQPDKKMDHLTCFFPGVLALAAQELHKTSSEFERWMQLAEDLTETCYEMYRRQRSGVAPEFVMFPDGEGMVNGDAWYLLRPEAFEALFYMWRTTKQQKWRDYGWNMFRAIKRWCKVPWGGYSGLSQVNVDAPEWDGSMPSYWFAETLKYAYLLFSPDDALDIQDTWVLNTEAHPLRMRDYYPLRCDDESDAKRA